MSLIRRGVEARAGVNYFSQTYNPLNNLYGQTSLWSSAGERVDEVTALSIASVLACVSLLADSVATMPLVCTVEDGGQRRIVETPEFLANPDPANTTYFELIHGGIMVPLALHGNAYVKVDRGRGGEPIGLQPLHPYQMNVMAADNFNGRKYVWLGTQIPNDDMLHIRWFTPPQSLVGISPILQQRTMMGLALAMDRYLAQWYGEGGTPSGVLETDKPLTTEAARNLRDTWESSQRKHRRPAVLSDGLKWRPVSVSAVDMDFVNTRSEVVISDIARIFRVPPHLLNIKGDGQTYQNVEAASLNFLIHTLQPWLARIEIALSSLLPPGMSVHFDPQALLRMDSATRARVQLTQIQSGTRTPNEARAVDGLPPYPGGDEFFMGLPGALVNDQTATPVGTDPDPVQPLPPAAAATDGVARNG